MNTFNVNNLEAILTRLISRLREQGVQELSFANDMYWDISIDQIDLLSAKPELMVGSLDDDISFLNRIIEEDFISNYLELERLAALFKFMAKQLTV
jgi:hypothetical protein